MAARVDLAVPVAYHCVRYLPGPQRIQSLVQSTDPLLGGDLAPAFRNAVRVRWEGRLHADFDGLPGAEENIRDGFCGG